jgi:hypothetical protein
MGGGSKGSGMRPEINVPLAPSPGVGPVQQPNPPVQQNYSQYYLPPNIEAMRQAIMTQSGSMPFGVRSPYRQVDPSSQYAAPRPAPVFKAAELPPVPFIQPTMDRDIEQRLKMLEMENALYRDRYMNNYGGGGN